jgi:CSLREA domain-containing protein
LTRTSPGTLIISALSAMLAFGLGQIPIVQATPFTVTKTADTNDGMCDSDCSLREAIIAANVLAGDDIISLPSGTYSITIPGVGEDVAATGDLDITDNLTIIGAGAPNSVIDGNGIVVGDRVLDIKSATVQLSGVTIQNGYPSTGNKNGGGILNIGMLMLTNSTIQGNVGGNGGGILNTGILTITASALISNTATTNGGGGLYNLGVLSVMNSLVSYNTISGTAEFGGGGIFADLFSTSTTVSNSTVSGNRANVNGGGIYINGAPSVILNNATITNNIADNDDNGSGDGGGISNQASLRNTLLAENIDIGGEAPDCSGTVTSQGYNLIQSTAGCTISGDATGNMTGMQPNLSPLQNNGGPTFTHALFAGSPAIDTGNPNPPGTGGNACEATDQRGVVRPINGRCDMGAYEGVIHRIFLPIVLRNP